jgi:hypothetical protein
VSSRISLTVLGVPAARTAAALPPPAPGTSALARPSPPHEASTVRIRCEGPSFVLHYRRMAQSVRDWAHFGRAHSSDEGDATRIHQLNVRS